MTKSIYKTIRLTPELAEWLGNKAKKAKRNFSNHVFVTLENIMEKEKFDVSLYESLKDKATIFVHPPVNPDNVR